MLVVSCLLSLSLTSSAVLAASQKVGLYGAKGYFSCTIAGASDTKVLVTTDRSKVQGACPGGRIETTAAEVNSHYFQWEKDSWDGNGSVTIAANGDNVSLNCSNDKGGKSTSFDSGGGYCLASDK